jgi:hypothetical protein
VVAAVRLAEAPSPHAGDLAAAETSWLRTCLPTSASMTVDDKEWYDPSDMLFVSRVGGSTFAIL